jgi:hypothetical protein
MRVLEKVLRRGMWGAVCAAVLATQAWAQVPTKRPPGEEYGCRPAASVRFPRHPKLRRAACASILVGGYVIAARDLLAAEKLAKALKQAGLVRDVWFLEDVGSPRFVAFADRKDLPKVLDTPEVIEVSPRCCEPGH